MSQHAPPPSNPDIRRAYHRWFSPHLSRDMELLAFGHAGARVLVFPTRDGRFYDYENWGLVRALAPTIAAGNLQLFCVDSIDRESLYADWMQPADRLKRHGDYEAYLLHEVLPFTASINPNPFLIAHGCSLGAFHAANLAFRHPQKFGKVVALSGRYDLTENVAGFRGLFDDHYDERVYFNTPTHFLPHLATEADLAALRRMEIILAVGETDAFLPSNQALCAILGEKNILCALHIWDGEAHRPRAWRRMVALYL